MLGDGCWWILFGLILFTITQHPTPNTRINYLRPPWPPPLKLPPPRLPPPLKLPPPRLPPPPNERPEELPLNERLGALLPPLNERPEELLPNERLGALLRLNERFEEPLPNERLGALLPLDMLEPDLEIPRSAPTVWRVLLSWL